jgi:hypothetical protein
MSLCVIFLLFLCFFLLKMSVFRATSVCLRSVTGGPQVVGAHVPSFDHFPYKAREVLHLYRDFWRVIYRYPPQERLDLMFRLRNEFRSKRTLAGHKVISAAVRRGQAVLEVQKSILDARGVRESSAGGGRRPRTLSLPGDRNPHESVDRIFDQVQNVAGHMLPGLKRYRASLPGPSHRYAANGNTDVLSAARPLRIR